MIDPPSGLQRCASRSERIGESVSRSIAPKPRRRPLALGPRIVARYLRAIAERHADVEPRVSALKSRVDKLEARESVAKPPEIAHRSVDVLCHFVTGCLHDP
jgi:hypothetical protein